jgi:hypothetical protein
MKIHLTIPVFLFTLIVFSTVTLAQITITSTDASAINAVGNVITNHLDSTTTSIDIGSPGATSWDFSALNSHVTFSVTSVLPSSTPYYLSDFPTSNVVVYFNTNISGTNGEGWAYSTQNANNYEQNGVVAKSVNGTDTFLVKAVYSPAQVFYPLPFTFNSQWGSDFVITNTIYFNGVPFNTTTANHTETVMVDAWGNMTMPGGAVLQALRLRRDDRYTSPSPPFYVRTISYSILTKSGATVEVVATDTTAPNSGIIQTDGVTWSSTGAVGVENDDQIPTQYSLGQNYPNPFNPSTTIKFQVPNSSFVNLKVYDVLGNEVATLVNEEKSAGSYEVNFDASQLSSGIYFYKLQAGTFLETKKMILIR